MRKFLPYQQYDVRAIEEWLNKQSMAGYRLVKMDGVFPTFKKYIDHQYHYRVRYIPEGKPTGFSHYWGKLYIYESRDKSTLPVPSYVKDSQLAARDRKFPFFALALLVALFAILEAVYSNHTAASPLFLGAAAVTAIAEVAWLALIFMDHKRGGNIAKGKVSVDTLPPNPKHKLLTLIVSLITILAMVNAVNLTDGLDGLASGTTAIVSLFLMLVALKAGAAGSVGFCAAIRGACLGFLVLNHHPA